MDKVLELHFVTEFGKTARISVNDPKEDLQPADIKTAMEQIIASGIFFSDNGDFTTVKEARLVSREVQVFDLAE